MVSFFSSIKCVCSIYKFNTGKGGIETCGDEGLKFHSKAVSFFTFCTMVFSVESSKVVLMSSDELDNMSRPVSMVLVAIIVDTIWDTLDKPSPLLPLPLLLLLPPLLLLDALLLVPSSKTPSKTANPRPMLLSFNMRTWSCRRLI